MILIVGLGNPGIKFTDTRHNFGRDVVMNFADKFDFQEFKFDKKINAQISLGNMYGKDIILILPETFMNLSGEAILKTQKKFDIKIEDMVVVHDDVDLPFGFLKLKRGGGNAGHNGLKDITKKLKTNEFIRLRLGIAPEYLDFKRPSGDYLDKFVLSRFNQEEESKKREIIDKAITALNTFIQSGLETAMNEVNKKS